ncbi:hypothetical protein WJX73_002662 [Symbiochloris irregularis]|uniref:Uncharacterized protein n=1 Tax=Symbiochloris irregularis TaxID=706552 RepID=A0AAW1NU54_9CHLO
MAPLLGEDPLYSVPSSIWWPAVTLVVLASVVVLRVITNHITLNGPPVFEGLPFVGGILKFLQGPMQLMKGGYQKYGEVFTVPVLHKKITFLLGPHASPHFYKASDDDMSQTEVYEFNVPTFGKGVVFDVDHKTRGEQFRFFAEALKSARLKLYVPLFVQETQDFFGKWGDSGIVDFKDVLADLIILTASRTLLGREVRENMFSQVTALLHDLDEGMKPISVLFPYLPIPAHNRRDRARAELSELFAKVIRARRADPERNAREADLLASFCQARYSPAINGGRELTEGEITGMLIAVLFAGQHTSSITSSWTGLYMIKHPDVWKEAVEEQRQVIRTHGEKLTLEALGDMPVLQRIITEALRLFPPLILLLRQCKRSFLVSTSNGHKYTIPKGHVVATSPAFQHRLPHIFERPDSFEPDRFADARAEDKAMPFSFIGFGGGRHGCMGSNFAYLQIKTIWSVLLRNFEMELLDPFPQADYSSMVVGPTACRVQYTRRPLRHRQTYIGAHGISGTRERDY